MLHPWMWFTAIALVGLLLPLRQLTRRLKLPDLPVRLIGAALLSWVAVNTIPLGMLPGAYRPWIYSLDDLLLSYLSIRLVLWSCLELPAALGWRKRPPRILIQLLMLGGCAVTTVVVLKELAKFDLVGLVTTSAVLTAVLGLAAQEPLKDLFSGMELQFNDSFQVGDFVDLGEGHMGVVESINWRDTCLRDITGTLVVVPNAKVTDVVVKNFVSFGTMGNQFSIGLCYSLPPARARALLLNVLEQHPLVLVDPPPAVRLKAFEESSIAYDILVFQRPGNMASLLDLRSELLSQMWYALERAGEKVPYPVRELKSYESSADSTNPIRRTVEQRRDLLALNPLFRDLNEEELITLAKDTRCLRFSPGEVVVREDDPGDSLFQVVQGQVEVLKQTGQGPPLLVTCLKSSDMFGEMSMLTDSSRSATVRASEKAQQECILLEVQRQDIGPLMQRNPRLMDRLAHLVSVRQGELQGLERENMKAQENQLLRRMQQLFSAVIF